MGRSRQSEPLPEGERSPESGDGIGPQPTRFKPPSRTSMSQNVLDQILTEIREGRLKPGERLPSERLLMEAFSVGRSTVREAVRGLVTLGLVSNRQGVGAVVSTQISSPFASIRRSVDVDQLNRRALLDLFDVREALETKAAEFAARRATPEDLAELQLQHKAVEREVRAGRVYFQQNALFHKAIAMAAHNPVLAESINLVVVQVREYREKIMRETPLMPQRDVKEHLAILSAIERRDPDAAREAMASHIRSSARVIESHGDPERS